MLLCGLNLMQIEDKSDIKGKNYPVPDNRYESKSSLSPVESGK